MRKYVIASIFVLTALLMVSAYAGSGSGKKSEEQLPSAEMSSQTEGCINCHGMLHPGIVADWERSRHAKVTPAMALETPELERRMSSDDIPDELLSTAVGCYECHALNPAEHTDNFSHFGYNVNVVVTPNDCKTCHAVEVEQYAGSKKAEALKIFTENPLFSTLVDTITSGAEVDGTHIIPGESLAHTKNKTCYNCHGTVVEVKGMRTVSSDFGDIEVPDLTNWPNQGVGRINPDGSLGCCTACHPRHGFSIKVARKPYTCSQCHLEPDVPAYNVWKESKHGNIFNSSNQSWDMGNVPWVPGEDFRAPTCAVCHNSLLATSDGTVIRERNHNFGDPLWVRILGIIYSHPQPKDGRTYIIENQDGLPMPTTFAGELASDYLIDSDEMEARRSAMMDTCGLCHSRSWVEGHFTEMDTVISDADSMVLSATKLLQQAWDAGIADDSNPFDETIEQMWIKQWLFYASSVRYVGAMGGSDYASFKNGWWELNRNLQEMKDYIDVRMGE